MLCCTNHTTLSLGTGPSCFPVFPQTVLLVFPHFPPSPPPTLYSSVFSPALLGWLEWELNQKLSCWEGPRLSEASPAQGSGQGPIPQQRSGQDLCVEGAVGSLLSGCRLLAGAEGTSSDLQAFCDRALICRPPAFEFFTC